MPNNPTFRKSGPQTFLLMSKVELEVELRVVDEEGDRDGHHSGITSAFLLLVSQLSL
jgi:hypothetical protein